MSCEAGTRGHASCQEGLPVPGVFVSQGCLAKHRNLGVLEQHKVVGSQFWRLEISNQGVQGPHSSSIWQGNPSLLLSSFQWFSSNLWLSLAYESIAAILHPPMAPSSSLSILPPLHVYRLRVQISTFCTNTSHTGSGLPPTIRLHLTRVPLERPYFQIQLHPEMLGLSLNVSFLNEFHGKGETNLPITPRTLRFRLDASQRRCIKLGQ